MKFGRLIWLAAFVAGASVSAGAATLPKLHAPGATTPATLGAKDKDGKNLHAHKVQKHKVAHVHKVKKQKVAHVQKVKKVKKVKKT
jgi:hypothetical protein